jgi:hypothetical protein
MYHLLKENFANLLIIGAMLFLFAAGCSAPDSSYERRELYGVNNRGNSAPVNSVARSSPESANKKTFNDNKSKTGKSNRNLNSAKSLGSEETVIRADNSAAFNSRGNRNASPKSDETISTAGATAKCRDGTLSYSRNRRGTCSHHGGVAVWY